MGAALSTIATIASIGGTIYSGVTQYQAARDEAASARANAEAQAIAAKQNAEAQAAATRRSAETQAKLYEQNAELARNQAAANAQDERTAESQLRDRIRRTRASQAAAYGASGVSVDSGSPLIVDTDTAVQGEDDVLTLRNNYARKSNSYRNQASMYEGRASGVRSTGDIDAQNILNSGYASAQNALNQGYAQANAAESSGRSALGGALISGTGLVADKWNYMSSSSKKKTQNKYYGSWYDGKALDYGGYNY